MIWLADLLKKLFIKDYYYVD